MIDELNGWLSAADEGRVEDLREFVRRGVDVNARDGWRENALARAVRGGHREATLALLELGADPNLLGSRGWSPTTHAALEHPELVPLLEAAGGRVELFEAVLLGDLSRAMAEYETVLNGPIDSAFAQYAASLNVAARLGRADLVSLLLDKKPDPARFIEDESPSPSRRAMIDPPWCSLSFGYPSYEQIRLIETQTLADSAIAGHREVVRLLIAAGVRRSLADAVALDDEAEVGRLLTKKGRRYCEGFGDGHLCRMAAKRGHQTILRILIEAGAGRGGVPSEGQPWAYVDAWFPAAEAGDMAALEAMIDAGANLDVLDRYSQTALMLAVTGGHREAARLLLDRGANPERRRSGDHSAMTRAILFHRELMPMLAEAGGKIGLREAVILGDCDLVRQFHAAGESIAGDAGLWYGDTFVMVAAEAGHLAMTRLLLDLGASLVQNDDVGLSLLDRAADGGHREVVELLIDRGADPNYRDWNGEYPIDHAAVGGHRPIVGLLLESGAKMTLLAAVALDDVREVDRLLRLGADPNQDGPWPAGWLPGYAAGRGNRAIVRRLVEAGARSRVADPAWPLLYVHSSILQAAAEGGHLEVVGDLLRRDPSSIDGPDDPARLLGWAAETGRAEVVRLLLRHGVDPRHDDGSGPALDRAGRNGHAAVVDLISRALAEATDG